MRFPRQILFALLMAALLAFAESALAAGTRYDLQVTGPTSRRLNLVLLAEGYTANQTNLFLQRATNVVRDILSFPPYDSYASYFNAYAIFVASNEEGSDHPSTLVYRDTYFNSTFDAYGIPQLLVIDREGDNRMNLLLQQHLPDYDIAGMLVNDTAYGGSGGVPYLCSAARESTAIAIHELGHSLAGLGDEYSDAYPGYPDIEEPNTTRETNRALIKWKSWIEDTTPIPTPPVIDYVDKIGLFEGAHYHATGWYRPKVNCRMRSLGADFCEVCAEALVKSIYGYVQPIDEVSPSTGSVVTLDPGGTATFRVLTLEPNSHVLEVRWYTNGVTVPGATSNVIQIPSTLLHQGTNFVRVEVQDATDLVRSDPTRLLQTSQTWTVHALPTPGLTLTRTSGALDIAWTSDAVGYVLESRSSFSAASTWQPLLQITAPASLTFQVTNSSVFFRLRRP